MAKVSIATDSESDRISYAHTSAVTVGDVINVAGIGVLIASSSFAANVSGIYYKRGIFQFAIDTGVSVAQGDRCFYSVSAGKVIKTGMVAVDFYLGRAQTAGTATAGYVNIQIGSNAADYRSTSGLTADRVAAIVGRFTGVNASLVTGNTLETITDVRFTSLDKIIATIASTPDANNRIVTAVANDGTATVRFATVFNGGALDYFVMKSV